jgi:hypothetical protein
MKDPNPDPGWQHWSAADISAPGGFEKHILGQSWLDQIADDEVPDLYTANGYGDDGSGDPDDSDAANYGYADATESDDPLSADG